LLVLSGTWIYLWQLFGASNQLMAALSLLIVTLWLRSTGRNPAYAKYPMLFMYFTTMIGTLITAYNLYASILSNPAIRGQTINAIGAVAMIIVAMLLFVAAAVIAWDARKAWRSMGPTVPRPVWATRLGYTFIAAGVVSLLLPLVGYRFLLFWVIPVENPLFAVILVMTGVTILIAGSETSRSGSLTPPT
jgi:hypothetical protein